MSDGITEARRGTYFSSSKKVEEKKSGEHSLVDIVKGTAKISHICNGIIYYNIDVDGTFYQLPIDCTDVNEWKDTYIQVEYKAVTLMRWIRKALKEDKLIRLNR